MTLEEANEARGMYGVAGEGSCNVATPESEHRLKGNSAKQLERWLVGN